MSRSKEDLNRLNDRENELETEGAACGCSDAGLDSRAGAGCGPVEPHADRVELDNGSAKRDDDVKHKDCSNGTRDATGENGSEGDAAGKQKDADPSDFDCSKMMEIMKNCCPDKMKNFSSMMPNFDGGCCPPDEDGRSKESV
jgi:hypothetical protein